MSKGDGPAANSFDNPRKVGWLYKQGGSGVTSHWRKRWFVAHQNYLFYYKKPDDKNPVGILSLPDYDSCSKTEGKEWKKPNTFLLDRKKDEEAPDGPSKSYALHSDTEEEMLDWIKVLQEEMKPAPGGGRHEANGRAPASKGKAKPKSASDAKVDPKAFNELSELALETPKLTHLTAARPKVRNRRPPKRYAVFHEDDSKEETQEESPPPSPKPLPSPSPTPTKKGHRPSAPMVPKPKPLTPPNKPRSETTASPDPAAAEGDQGSEVKKKAPPTPRKPSKDRPIPPSKPSKSNIEIKPEEPEYAVPMKKPRPTPPAKPRPSSVTTPPETPTNPDAPVPKPRPRKKTVLSEEPVVEEAGTPISGDTPIIKDVIKEEAALSPPSEEEVTILEENIYDIVEHNETLAKNKTVNSVPTEAENALPETETESESNIQENAEKVVSDKADDIDNGTVAEKQEQTELPKEKAAEDVKPEPTEPSDSEGPSAEIESESKPSDSDSVYEDIDMGAPAAEQEESDSGSEYEEVEFEPIQQIIPPSQRLSYEPVNPDPLTDATIDLSVAEQPQASVETSSKGQSTSSYESMDPAVLGEYVDMEGTVFEKETVTDDGYNRPRDWIASSDSPSRTKIGEYDVPPPARPASGDLERGSPGIISSSGSTGSRGQSSPGHSRKDRLSALRAGSVDSRGSDRDRTPSAGSQGLSKPSLLTPPASPSDSGQSVSGTLRQAKEILRLAHMVRAEAEEDRELARRELELARREKHDAELLKKNAAQILKMAKERLNGSKTV